MGQALLVSIDIPLGREVISAMETAGLTVNVALWAWLSEYEEWRLVLASRKLDKENLLQAYMLVNSATDAAGIGIRRVPEIMILKMTDPFIRELRRLYGKSKDVEGLRLGGYSIGGRGIQDAWVYRIT
jgi:hypothetical protein